MAELHWLSPQDLYLFNEGSHVRLYDKFGSHPATVNGVAGYHFAVWAPNADAVSVIGDFNGWDARKHRMSLTDGSGVWSLFIPNVKEGICYKYRITSKFNGYGVDKSDPFAFTTEIAPKSAAVTWNLDYEWNDADWLNDRKAKFLPSAPVSIYELHLGSWMRETVPPYLSFNYRKLAPLLTEYVKKLGFTHVELMPVTEHPYYGSWGYQATGYFAATSRYGTPQDLMYLIDYLHQAGIGVILDWVPSHFATDEHSLGYFDGTHLYEHADPRQGYHPDWGSYVFNYERHEVRSFLLSSALFWLDKYHIDGIRVDAVASMLYLDYSRKQGEWIPNRYGGKENIAAIEFLRRFNHEVYTHFPDVQTIAEESTSWPMVSRPAYLGGLGFGYKWDMGWMHDTLKYAMKDPIYRRHHHNELTFRQLYANTENYVLPLSHDEVVHGKGPLWDKMAGDSWQKFAGMRLLLTYMYCTNGKKLLFMGGEFAQRSEWKHDTQLPWTLLEQPTHRGVQQLTMDLNAIYKSVPAMHELDTEPGGFEWIDCHDADRSILSFLRIGKDGPERILCVFNFTPTPRYNYRVGVPGPGVWTELLNTDAECYAGSNVGNAGSVHAEYISTHGRPYSLNITLPPLAAVLFRGSI
ncbi:MAG: 1,4-alpha-glucan branching protein GlgB [Fimbriiglobus sp.]